MATVQQVTHHDSLVVQAAKTRAAALRDEDPAITVRDWRINASASNDEVWFHVTAGAMHGGTFLSSHQARALAALLINAAGETQ
jgi:hypothetical protein